MFGATPTTTAAAAAPVVDLSRQKLRPFQTRAGDTCETQRDAAAQNSVRDSKPGKPVVYCSRCDCPELYEPVAQPKAAPVKDPSTS